MTTSPPARLTDIASKSDSNLFRATPFFAADGSSNSMMDGCGQSVFHGKGWRLEFDIHEAPQIIRRNHNIRKTRRVVTVEPGLYHPGMGGMRLEDIVLVAKTGCKNPVRIPKILEV